jgi:predicted PurR-regulated permease PerM
MTLLTPARLQAALWLGIGLLLLVLLYVLAPILTPFAAGAVLAYLLAPGVDWFERRRVPRAGGALIMILLAGLAVFGLALILVPVLQKEAVALQTQVPALINKLNEVVGPKLQEWFGITLQFDTKTLRELLTERLGPQDELAGKILAGLRTSGTALLGVLGTLLLVPVVLFYLLVDWHGLKQRFERYIPRRWHDLTMTMLAEIDGLLAQFMRGQLSVMLVLAAYYALALAIAGFQTALPIGVLTGLLVFIPYVGFALGLVLALLAALLQFPLVYGLVAVGIIYGLGQAIESFFLTPRLVGERIGLHPLAVIFALLAFGQVFGFFGVLLALPASAALLVALRRLSHAYLTSEFYSRT